MDTPLSREVEVFHCDNVTRVVESIDNTFVMTPEMWVTLRPKLSRYLRDVDQHFDDLSAKAHDEYERGYNEGYEEGRSDGEDIDG